MTSQEKIQFYLNRAIAGAYGSPEKPNCNSFGNSNFWRCFFGHRKPSEFKGTVSYEKAVAGKKYAEYLANQDIKQ